MNHILSSEQFTKEKLEDIFKLTDEIKRDAFKFKDILSGMSIATLFFEPSTRTRLSFESAIGKLGAAIVSVTNPEEQTSVAKNESFEDTIKIISSYVDLVILRHPEVDAAVKASKVSLTPIINAGSGSGEHPTQSLLDLYTIREYKGHLDNISIAVIGDLLYGRTVHSLVKVLSLYDNITIYGLSNDDFKLPEEYIKYLKQNNVNYIACNSYEDIPSNIDVLYQTRIQKERFKDSKKSYNFDIDKKVLNRFSPNTLLMHPLPRNGEISPSIDNDKRSIYFMQARNGLYVRMALILIVLNKTNIIDRELIYN